MLLMQRESQSFFILLSKYTRDFLPLRQKQCNCLSHIAHAMSPTCAIVRPWRIASPRNLIGRSSCTHFLLVVIARARCDQYSHSLSRTNSRKQSQLAVNAQPFTNEE